MRAAQKKAQVVQPGKDGQQVARVLDFFQAHDPEQGPFHLVGADPDDRVELPADLARLVRRVAEDLHRGMNVSLVPTAAMLTTQEAATLLGVSRPTVIRLLDENKIPYDKVNSHRRIRLADLMAYRDERRSEQREAMESLTLNYDLDEDSEAATEHLRKARRTVARRRGISNE
ncbi:helix-turn-helix domain-containing protein [Actinokineospora sp. 24-640]